MSFLNCKCKMITDRYIRCIIYNCRPLKLTARTCIISKLEADVEKAIRERVENGCGNLYVLVNYTALFSTRNVLKKMEGEG